jgi:hypothetical protein
MVTSSDGVSTERTKPALMEKATKGDYIYADWNTGVMDRYSTAPAL